jgi:hypothetical protein
MHRLDLAAICVLGLLVAACLAAFLFYGYLATGPY